MAVRRALAVALLLGACSSPRTEVLVVTGSDLATPGELGEIRIEVRSPDDVVQSSTATLGAADPPLPRTLGVVHEGGPLGPFRATVTGFSSGAPLVTREADFTFQPGRTLVLRMDLLRACGGMMCGAEMTCAEAGCRSRTIAAGELTEYDGPAEPTDAGPPDSTDAGPGDTCDPGFADCDGDPDNGCEADLSRRQTCGDCDTRCRRPTNECCDGACATRC